jgi:serine/threonine protein phosphatase PrpC
MTPDPRAADGTGLVLRSGAATHVGQVRTHNEDSALADGTVFVVADGMGGHAAGEVASGIVIDVMRDLAHRPSVRAENIVSQLRLANQRILESTARNPEQAGMGTTATGLAIVQAGGSDHWAVFNIGDSRTYRFLEGRLTPLTVDHSEVRELLDAGVITADEAVRHPLRNVVTRSLGSDPAPTADIWVFPPYPGERFIICSDGLTGELSDDRITAIVAAAEDPQSVADALVRAAVQAGGRDNVTAIVVALDTASEGDADNDADTAPRNGAGGEG